MEDHRSTVTKTLKYLAVGALAFQGAHLAEHVAQVGYWFLSPAEAPWMTPWAVRGRDALALGGHVALGNELLHFLGNIVFLAGLVALGAYWRRQGGQVSGYLHTALWLQSLHVVEHVALTASTVGMGRAIGVSTFLGLVDGSVMTSFRVWFHFLLNLVATWYAARALVALHRQGLLAGGEWKEVTEVGVP